MNSPGRPSNMADTSDVETPSSPADQPSSGHGQLVTIGQQPCSTLSPQYVQHTHSTFPSASTMILPNHFRFFDSRPIRIILANSGRYFWAHSWHLALSSTEISKSLSLGKKNRDELRVEIPGDDEDTVQRFLCWLYDRHHLPFSTTVHEKYIEIVRLFILAETYGVRHLREDLVSTFFSMVRAGLELPSWEAIDLAFEHLPASSAGCWMLVHAFVWHETRSLLTEPMSTQEMRKRPKFAGSLTWRLTERLRHVNEKNPFAGDPRWYTQSIKRVTGNLPVI